jgi:acyl dehydratase
MRVFNGFDEIKSAIGTKVGASDWIEITQDRINTFAEATCDEQWIHVDQDRAKQELPGGTRSIDRWRCPRSSPCGL